ncbi:hypothetical protein QJQ45_013104 [Haematococcus lacustris]|nr:hypothetical protein QJQ45_013104 [Haematococcus lacustris]
MAASSIGPGAQIDLLTDDNFQFWQIRVRNALIEHNLFQIVDRGITSLPTAPIQGSSQATQDAYAAALTVRDAENTADAKAKAMILRYVSLHHLFAIGSAVSAKDAWDNIKAEYTQSSLAHQTQLQQQLSMLRLNPGETISQFFSRLQMLQANLRACNCNPSDTSIVLSVLAAMPDEFRPTVEQLRYDQSSAALVLSKVERVGYVQGDSVAHEEAQQQAADHRPLAAGLHSWQRSQEKGIPQLLREVLAGSTGWVEIHVEGEAASYRSGIGQVTAQMAEVIKVCDNLEPALIPLAHRTCAEAAAAALAVGKRLQGQEPAS